MSKSTKTRYQIDLTRRSLLKLKQDYSDDKEFIDNFDLFLSRARSILDYMRNEYVSHPTFRLWYKTEIPSLYSDKIFKYFDELRNKNIHQLPIQRLERRESSGGGSFNHCTADFNGYPDKMDPNYDSSTGKLVMRFFKKFPNDDIADLCQYYLDIIIKFVEDCETNFP